MTERSTLPRTQKAKVTPKRALWREKLRRPAVLCLLLAVVTLAVYLPVGRHGYVNYDDSDYVAANAHVQGGLRWENVVWAFKSGHASNWHPLTWISHMLDTQVFGDKPGAQHLVSVGFHIVDTVLLFLLLRRLTRAPWRSFMVAALFALHPLHVESVAWISERKDVLSAFFFLLTLGAYVRYAQAKSEGRNPKEDRDPPTESRAQATLPNSAFDVRCSTFDVRPGLLAYLPPSIFYLLSLLFFALGLMSKPMLVTLPFVLLLLDYWPLARMREEEVSGQRSEAGDRPSRFTFHATCFRCSSRSCRSLPWCWLRV